MPPDLEHTRPALGQVADLGTLYDAHKDTFHNANVIQGNPPPASISIDKIGSHSVELATAGTTKDRLTSFGVTNDLAASILAGFVPTAGSARYLEPPQLNEDTLQGAVLYEILTESLYLNLSSPSLRDYIVTTPIRSNRSTHIVTGITYGVKVILGARHASSAADGQQQEVMKKLDVVKTMFAQHDPLFIGSIGEETRHKPAMGPLYPQLDDLAFVFFSDFANIPKLHALKPSAAEQIIGRVPAFLKKTNHGRGIPLTYRLVSLDYLRNMLGLQLSPLRAMRHPPDWVFDEFALTYEKWNNLDRQITHVIHEIDSIDFIFTGPRPQSLDKALQQVLHALRASKNFGKSFSSTIERLRAGLCPSNSLEILLDDHLHSSNSPERITEILSKATDNVALRKALARGGGHYFDYEDAQNAMSTSNSIYILFFTEDMQHGNKSWKESQDVITRLLNRNSGDYNVAVAECLPGELSFSQPRISHYSRGEVKIANMLETMDLVDQCFIRRGFKSEAPEVQPAPRERRLVRLPCPHPLCDKSINHDWTCYHCRCIMEYHEGFFYCDCGRTGIADSSWQCNGEAHGKKFVNWDNEELKAKLVSLSSYQEMNILVLGESGVGKSTFINAFYNYMMFDSLDIAMDHEKLEYAIPSSFTIQHFDEDHPENGFVECNVKIGQDDEEQDGSAGQSATQSPTVYRLQIGDRLVRLIDTPGIGDTRGEDFDKINMSKVLSTLNRFSNLHGVIILLKPNNARLNVVFKFCVQELLTHLHRDAVRNIIWGFTNTRQSNYGPGDSMKPLKTLLAKHASLGLRLTPKNVFCFDSESFRCLAAKKQADYTMNNLDDFRRSWDRSAKQTTALLEHVESLEAHRVKSTMSINRAREIIERLTQPMADITDSIERTIRLNEEKVKELSSAKSKGKSLQDRLHFERIEIDVERLGKPRTVCKNPNCVEMVDVRGIKRPLYKSICHDPCHLKDVDEDVVGHSHLMSCKAFKGNSGYCKKCRHHWQQHLHIRYMQTERTVLDIDPDVQAKLDANASDLVLKKLGLKSLKNKINESQASLKEVQDAAIKFGLYLKKKSIAPYNDAMIEYLDVLINDEKHQISHCNACGEDTKKNEERLESLKQNKERYGHRIKVLDAEMSKSDENAQLLTEEGIDELVQKLCNLKHYGKDLEAMMEMAEWSKASGFREQELRPRLARNASNLSWMSPVSNVASAMKNTVLGAASSMAGGLLGRRGVNPREPPSPSPQPKPSSSRGITRPNDPHREIKVEDDGSGTYEPRGTKRGHAQTAAGQRPEGRYSLRERKRRVIDWVANVERET
ncbi:P-loop containing nucleoside triphosphate hydrolase [Apiospora arundinis]|uniref:P-loop containing nucleoside triphosphate hydrolase n=1 Tax=Apiospora arundinis TaxID=335852 RepID=A0ABR2I8E6_9PEZI